MDRQRLSAIVSFVVAVGIIIAGVLGPLATGVIRFRMPEFAVNQYVGGEVVTLFLAVPALVAAGVLWLRQHRLAPVLAIGPAAYTVYTFITAIVGQEYGRYDGNVENAFFLYAGLVLGGGVIVVLAGSELLSVKAPTLPDGLRTVTAGVFLAIAVFFALAWVGQIAQVYGGERTDEYVGSPTLFWLIKLMDLAFLLPLFATTGIALLRRRRLAFTLAYGMVSYAVCMAAAVLGMAIAMVLRDDPSASAGMIAFLTPVTLLLAVLAWRLLMTYAHGGEGDMAHRRPTIPIGRGHAG
jgi:hypothetical protein